MESRLEKIFSMAINCMSLAVWLGEDRKCFAAVVGSDLTSGLSMVRRCSLNRSFKRRLVSPMYCKLQLVSSVVAKPAPLVPTFLMDSLHIPSFPLVKRSP